MQRDKYKGWFDICKLSRIEPSIHKFYNEMPPAESYVLTIGMSIFDEKAQREKLYADLSWDGAIVVDDIVSADDIEVVNKERVLLFWIDLVDILEAISSSVQEEHLTELAARTVMRFLEEKLIEERGKMTDADETKEAM